MTDSRAFVKNVRSRILHENMAMYRNLIDQTDLGSVSDPYWANVLSLVATRSDDDKETILKIMRQVSVDTISNLLGVLDGVTKFEESSDDFFLTTRNSKEKLNGDLQDYFLELEECEGI